MSLQRCEQYQCHVCFDNRRFVLSVAHKQDHVVNLRGSARLLHVCKRQDKRHGAMPNKDAESPYTYQEGMGKMQVRAGVKECQG